MEDKDRLLLDMLIEHRWLGILLLKRLRHNRGSRWIHDLLLAHAQIKKRNILHVLAKQWVFDHDRIEELWTLVKLMFDEDVETGANPPVSIGRNISRSNNAVQPEERERRSLDSGILRDMLCSTDLNGDTALHIAARENNNNMSVFLLDLGAPVYIKDGRDCTSDHYFLGTKRDEAVWRRMYIQ